MARCCSSVLSGVALGRETALVCLGIVVVSASLFLVAGGQSCEDGCGARPPSEPTALVAVLLG